MGSIVSNMEGRITDAVNPALAASPTADPGAAVYTAPGRGACRRRARRTSDRRRRYHGARRRGPSGGRARVRRNPGPASASARPNIGAAHRPAAAPSATGVAAAHPAW